MKENKLIAEFMGIKNTNGLVFQDANTKEFHPINYHTSWDWLMPVIAKIVEDYGSGWSFEEGYNLEVRYKSVVNFIKECNNERK